MTLIQRRPLLVHLSLIALSLALTACQTPPSPVARSSAFPPQAPALIPKVAMVLGVGAAAAGAASCVPQPHQPEAEEFAVSLQDPGGQGGAYQFSPTDYTFDQGQVANFTLSSDTEFHTFTVDDLGLDACADAGETVEFSFTFDRPGTYSLICVPHEANGMVGTITVRPAAGS